MNVISDPVLGGKRKGRIFLDGEHFDGENHDDELNKVYDDLLNNVQFEFVHEITNMKWNGSILSLEGYCYFNYIPVMKIYDVKKELTLIDLNENAEYSFVLEDIPFTKLKTSPNIDNEYLWAGFQGTINLATVVKPYGRPLPAGEYTSYIRLEVRNHAGEYISEYLPMGDIRKFLKDDFYSTKMEYFSAKSQLLHNVMVTYDIYAKSMLIKSTKQKDFNPSELYGDIKNKTGKPGPLYRFMRSKVFLLFYYFFHIFPVKENKVLFASDSREEIGGNLQFVYEEMKERNLDYEYKFMFKENSFVKKTSLEIIKLAHYAATSRVIMLEENYPMISLLKIRKNTELIQLWHGAGAFKKFGYSRLGQPGGPKVNSKDHRNYTKAVVSSKNIISQYAEGFDVQEEAIYPLGIPRTDIFFNEEYKERKRAELYGQYPFLKNKKVILFAPTFRGRGRKEAHYPIENLHLDRLYENLKDEYVFIFKLHFINLNKVTMPLEHADFFYDFTDYRDVNDLLLITDILITDYSSICFDFSLLDKPMLFFAHDVEEYISKRGFYYEYQSFIPGHLVKTTDALIEKIVNKDFAVEKIKNFRDYFFDYQDGQSTKRVVDQLILNIEEI
ncbi:CDP-ribitol ribitolphosphotransferase / teichoic acid ribitol-phosphate polymerase [Cytobacillus horneckiae]|uniref:CDP-glycerol glycerophosphotransferase family protein n=1 Tax=Cytobacillus horneckiae TaxID=549687 RepID=UPI0019D18D88|nr:CDP-glycerol glycerophosphotransferase family protein [Cytobacillus horneckiae]MBN6885246.1 CDP-glycerol glycerophosphotransferase family protein [Cytobacillus horneckiae]